MTAIGRDAEAAAERAIYHAALPEDWAAALALGEYTTSTRGRSLAEVGFIHCSFRHQLEAVANRGYADVTDLVVLRLDTARIGSAVVAEPGDGTAERFPHVYGPIPVTAVVSARPWHRDSDLWRLAD